MAGLKIRKGDKVQVLSGKDKGKTGTVSRALPEKDKVIVDGVNVAKKHQKPNPVRGVAGGIVEIAKAIEELFKVQVEKVNTLHVQGKLRRQGKFEGYTASWKKAIVTLTEDSKTIEFFDGMV